MTPRLCRLCGARPVSPARMRARDYRCNRCRDATPGQQRAVANYQRSPAGRAKTARNNARRIFAGRTYHSRALTVDLARAVNAHIKDRRHAFIERQSSREETESVAAGRVPPETAF